MKIYYCVVWGGQYVRINIMDKTEKHIVDFLFPTEHWDKLKRALESEYTLEEYDK